MDHYAGIDVCILVAPGLNDDVENLTLVVAGAPQGTSADRQSRRRLRRDAIAQSARGVWPEASTHKSDRYGPPSADEPGSLDLQRLAAARIGVANHLVDKVAVGIEVGKIGTAPEQWGLLKHPLRWACGPIAPFSWLSLRCTGGPRAHLTASLPPGDRALATQHEPLPARER